MVFVSLFINYKVVEWDDFFSGKVGDLRFIAIGFKLYALLNRICFLETSQKHMHCLVHYLPFRKLVRD